MQLLNVRKDCPEQNKLNIKLQVMQGEKRLQQMDAVT